MTYTTRLVDEELDVLCAGLPAISLDGAKGVGKTATATRRATAVFSLDRRESRTSVEQDPEMVLAGSGTTFIDEWPRVPDVWDVVRRAVDDGAEPGRFLLAGSAMPPEQVHLHSGAGRIVRLLMRPMSLPERGIETTSVSFSKLLDGRELTIDGETAMRTPDYVDEILASGFPGIRSRASTVRRSLLESYVDQIVEHDILEAGGRVRRPVALRGWLAAYGAATATAASYASVARAATPGEEGKPAKETAMAYRDLLQRLWILDPLPAWVPAFTHLTRLGQTPKHHLVDPALAATLVGATAGSLLRGDGPMRNDETFFGALFESLAVQTIRCLAQASQSRAYHLRTQGGEHEIDLIVERPDHKVAAVEIKSATTVRPADVAHLHWLGEQAPGMLVAKVIVNTGSRAYRRPDGVAVLPLALLGP